MDLNTISKLIGGSRFDVCHAKCTFDPHNFVYHSKINGKRVNLLKILLSSNCRFDCAYCQNAWRRGVSLSPEEISRLFYIMKNKGLVSGAFISSAINYDPDTVMERVVETGRLIREYHKGYLHLKIVPGASEHLIKEAIELANRVSINIETTSKDRMSELSSNKMFKEDILRKERLISRYIRKFRKAGYRKSHTTQIISGLGESDVEILQVMEEQYRDYEVSRLYISPFKPLTGTPLESKQPENKKRVIKLYRMDALLRIYDYPLRFIKSIVKDGFLPEGDPKVIIAEEMHKKGILKDMPPEYIPGCGKKISELIKSGKSLLEIKKSGYSIKRISAYADGQTRLYQFYG